MCGLLLFLCCQFDTPLPLGMGSVKNIYLQFTLAILSERSVRTKIFRHSLSVLCVPMPEK